LKMPITLVGSPVLQVFYKRVADLRGDSRQTRRLLLQTWRNLALLAILPCAGVAVFGEIIFVELFGETWRTSGRLAEVLVLGLFVFFIGYPTSNILVITERVKSFLVWQVAQFLLVASALFAAVRASQRSLEWTVTLLVGAQLCVYVLSMLLQWQAASVTASRSEDRTDILGGTNGQQ